MEPFEEEAHTEKLHICDNVLFPTENVSCTKVQQVVNICGFVCSCVPRTWARVS